MYKFFAVHVLICILFYIINAENYRDKRIYEFLIVLLIPVFGIAYFIFISIFKRFKSDSEGVISNYSRYIRENIPYNVVRAGTMADEMNVIPVREALILNDSKIKRKLLIDVIKKNSTENIPILKKALENSDTEVSHYAAVAITEFRNYFINTIQKVSVEYENDKKNVDTLISYINIVKEYIKSGLLDKKSLKKYKYLYSKRLEELLEMYDLEEKYFVDKINCDMELGNYTSAKEYCIKFYEAHSDSDEAYVMQMKLYYVLKDFRNFKRVLDKLKQSSLQFSNKTLNIVRFWIAGELDES
ncbi:hypothetical protein ACFHWD_14685 [Clostridium sp. MT-14]|uniref:hypothetical protein n=1 Tax=Clostridium sp. MT-14 TaxID=3348360 RepID=UPI0035F2BF2E